MHNSINTQWKPFRIGDLFDIKIGNVIDGNKADKTGRAPYITRKETNNGLDGFIRADKSLMNLSFPVITIGNETAKPFVQNFPFFTGTKVNILSSKTPTNRWVLQFICVCIELHKNKYSYSYTSNSSRLAKQVILLPSKGDEPDWHFMESYMRQKEQSLLKPIVEQLCKRLIYSEIQGGVIYLPILGDHSNSMKSSLLSKGARDLKRPTISMVRHHMFRPRRLTMGLMGLSATKTV